MTAVHPVVLIDASGWLFRAFHALPPLTNPQGEPTGAVYGMINMLRRLQRDVRPERIAIVFDARGQTFREEIYPEYKANREATPEALLSQFPKIEEVIRALGLPLLRVDGVEADDVIGTLATRAAARGETVLIVTSDKDLAQLVGERVNLLDTMTNRHLDPAGVVAKFGVQPNRIVDYLALVGDVSDNIPGIPLVGPKTAAKWISAYGSLDGIVQHAAEIKGKAGENLRAHLGQLSTARQLATIRCDVDLPGSVESLSSHPPDKETLRNLYCRLGFDRLLAELDREKTGDLGHTVFAGSRFRAQDSYANATKTTIVLTKDQFEVMFAELQEAELISIDTETNSLDALEARLVGLSFSVQPGRGWYVPLNHDYLGAPEQLSITYVIEALRPLLTNASKPKVGQHLKYDINVLTQHGLDLEGIAYDTMLESYILDAASNRHDLDTLAERYLRHQTIRYDDVTGKGRARITFNQVPVDKAGPYAAEDADIVLRLHDVLYPKIREIASLEWLFLNIEMPLVPVLARMERVGVKVDAPQLATISVELAQRMAELEKRAWIEAGAEFNLGSTKQLQTILFEALRLPVTGRTPKGDPSTAENVLEALATEHPLPRYILEWRQLAKLRSTYAETLPKQINRHTHRIHTSYHQAVAATGRLSSSDPNLQNIPVRTAEGRRIRQAFIADDGCALLSVDYSQIELRLMAHFSGDQRLQKAFQEGLDIHRATASEVFGLDLESVSADQRRTAKAINFGLIYGMSAFGLARQLGIPRTEAQAYIKRFFSRYPQVSDFMETTRQKARDQGYVETLYGRRLYLPAINSRNAGLRQYAERTAINAPLQGTAADLIKHAMIDLDRWLPFNAPGVQMILQVHDELVFEGPVDPLQAMAPAIGRRMCRVRDLDVSLAADWGLGKNWDDSHRKQGTVASTDSD